MTAHAKQTFGMEYKGLLRGFSGVPRDRVPPAEIKKGPFRKAGPPAPPRTPRPGDTRRRGTSFKEIKRGQRGSSQRSRPSEKQLRRAGGRTGRAHSAGPREAGGGRGRRPPGKPVRGLSAGPGLSVAAKRSAYEFRTRPRNSDFSDFFPRLPSVADAARADGRGTRAGGAAVRRANRRAMSFEDHPRRDGNRREPATGRSRGWPGGAGHTTRGTRPPSEATAEPLPRRGVSTARPRLGRGGRQKRTSRSRFPAGADHGQPGIKLSKGAVPGGRRPLVRRGQGSCPTKEHSTRPRAPDPRNANLAV